MLCGPRRLFLRASGGAFERSNFDGLIDECFVGFIATRKLERVGYIRFALGHACNDVRTADPVRFLQIGLRPLRRVIGMGVIETNNVLVAFSGLALDADKFLGINMVAVLRRVDAGIAATGGRGDSANIAIHLAEKDPAAFMWIGLLAVTANLGVIFGADFQHEISSSQIDSPQSHRGTEKTLTLKQRRLLVLRSFGKSPHMEIFSLIPANLENTE